jgi:hypothetical protein
VLRSAGVLLLTALEAVLKNDVLLVMADRVTLLDDDPILADVVEVNDGVEAVVGVRDADTLKVHVKFEEL